MGCCTSAAAEQAPAQQVNMGPNTLETGTPISGNGGNIGLTSTEPINVEEQANKMGMNSDGLTSMGINEEEIKMQQQLFLRFEQYKNRPNNNTHNNHGSRSNNIISGDNILISSSNNNIINHKHQKTLSHGIPEPSFSKAYYGHTTRINSQFLKNNNEEIREGYECCICFEDFLMDDIIGELHCGHYFHKKCIKNWFRQEDNKDDPTCPFCRTPCKRTHTHTKTISNTNNNINNNNDTNNDNNDDTKISE